jgi:hypothetical protein
MGQRSQIYFRANMLGGKYVLVAQYFQWNYGTRMVSRARGILEWLESEKQFATLFYKGSSTLAKLRRVMEINWDYHDVVPSIDIIKEYEEGYYDSSLEMFIGQDNNDGQLIIDMIIDHDHKDKKGNYPVKFKYAFLDWDSKFIGNGEDYMQWNENYGDDGPAWRENQYIQKEIKYTERNIRYLDKHATLMTKEEVEEYINHDYVKDMGLEVKKDDEQTADKEETA